MLSSDYVTRYTSDPTDPEAKYQLCHGGVKAFLDEITIQSKNDIIKQLDTSMMLWQNPFVRYLRNLCIYRKIELCEEMSLLYGLTIMQAHINLIQKGLHGGDRMSDDYTKELVSHLQSDIQHLYNLKMGIGKESIVTAYSPIVPYQGAFIKKPVVVENPDQETKDRVATMAAAEKMMSLMQCPATALAIMRSMNAIDDCLNLPGSYVTASKQDLMPCCMDYLHAAAVFHTKKAFEMYLAGFMENGISAAMESVSEILRDFPDEEIENSLLKETNQTVINANHLVQGKKANVALVKEHMYDIHAIIANIQLQRRFRPSAYTSTGAISLPRVAGYSYYDNYVIIEPEGDAGDGSLSEYVYVPVTDDLCGAQEVVLKCWKDGSRIEVLAQQGFRNEMFADPDSRADNPAIPAG